MLDAIPADYTPRPRQPDVSQLPQAASFAERFAPAPGQPGSPQINNPALARALAAYAGRPQTTAQGGPVPPASPAQPPSPLQRVADKVAGPTPTSSGDAGAPAATFPFQSYDRTEPFPLPPNASIADQVAMQNAGRNWAAGGQAGTGLLRALPMQGQQSPYFIPNSGVPTGGVPNFYGGEQGPPPARINVFPQQQPPAGTSAVDAALLDYLRKQAQQQPDDWRNAY